MSPNIDLSLLNDPYEFKSIKSKLDPLNQLLTLTTPKVFSNSITQYPQRFQHLIANRRLWILPIKNNEFLPIFSSKSNENSKRKILIPKTRVRSNYYYHYSPYRSQMFPKIKNPIECLLRTIRAAIPITQKYLCLPLVQLISIKLRFFDPNSNK